MNDAFMWFVFGAHVTAGVMRFWFLPWLDRRNPNGSGMRRCSCCGCHDGCDEHCHEKERRCKIHGVRLPIARVQR